MTRRRYVYRNGEMVDITLEASTPPQARLQVIGDEHHAGARAPDGTDIGSKTKRREWMASEAAQGRPVADSSDFSDGWRAREASSREREAKAKRHGDLVESYRKLRRG